MRWGTLGGIVLTPCVFSGRVVTSTRPQHRLLPFDSMPASERGVSDIMKHCSILSSSLVYLGLADLVMALVSPLNSIPSRVGGTSLSVIPFVCGEMS